MSDDDKSSLLGLDEGYNVILTVFDEQMFLLSPKCKKKVSDENYEKQHLQTLVSLSATAASAAARRRAFFSWVDSGRYLLRSLNSCVAVFLSRI